jgi:hypothetical protein
MKSRYNVTHLFAPIMLMLRAWRLNCRALADSIETARIAATVLRGRAEQGTSVAEGIILPLNY